MKNKKGYQIRQDIVEMNAIKSAIPKRPAFNPMPNITAKTTDFINTIRFNIERQRPKKENCP